MALDPIRSNGKTLTIDPSQLVPSILVAITGKDSTEIIELSHKIDTGKGTKRDHRRLLKLIDRANKRISN